jgi:sugar phosphate permease
MSLGHACFSAGVVAGSLGTAALRDATPSLGLPFALVALAIALASVAFTRLQPAPIAGESEQRSRLPLRRLPQALLVLGLLGALAYFVENAWQSWGAVYLHRSLDASATTAALAPACFAASAVAGRLAGQAVAAHATRRGILAVGAAVGGGATLAAAEAGTIPFALVAIAAAGFGTSLCAPAVMSLVGDAAGAAERASAVSIVTSLAYLGFLLGPAFVGAVSAASSLRSALLAVSVVAGALCLLALVLLDGGEPSARPGRTRRKHAHV